MAVAVQVVSPQRHDAVAHQKRQHNERGKPPDDKPCDLFFRCGQLERPVGAHCADDHHEHELENRKRIFASKECANIHEYNIKSPGAYNRIVLLFDEFAQVLDKKGLDKALSSILWFAYLLAA